MKTEATSKFYHDRAKQFAPRRQAFIDGEFVDAASGDTFVSVNPATGEKLAAVASCGPEDAERAVRSARRSFESGSWRDRSPAERGRILIRLAELVEKNAVELALTETLDMGKPISDSLSKDIPGAALCLRWYGEAIDKIYDEIAPTGPHSLTLITREPIGVVVAVVPWNYPLMMACVKIAPALAAGNSVILKPAEQSPLSALRLAELGAEAGLPDGVLNVVPGFGETVGQALGRHMDVDMVAFTGSTAVGKRFQCYSGESNLKQIQLECGGKTPNIILADAPDLDAAAKAAALGAFINQGEVCNAGSRLIVERSIKDEMLERIDAYACALRPGDPLDPATQAGALVDGRHLERVLDYVSAGKAEGATLRLGGSRILDDTGGYFMEPTIFDCVDNNMTIAREEIFGPVLSVIVADDEHDAIRIGNDSIYGLAAAVWTRDLKKAHHAARKLRAGIVWINCFDEHDIRAPFGGFKQSGIGRDKSLHALDKYTELKTTRIAF